MQNATNLRRVSQSFRVHKAMQPFVRYSLKTFRPCFVLPRLDALDDLARLVARFFDAH
jgi:hypothetical protein